MNIGFIGLGSMGQAMAANLIKAGHVMHIWARSPGSMEKLKAQGARVCTSPKDLAAQCDVVLTCVTASADMEQVVLGDNGIIHGARRNMVLIDHSTISPDATRHIGDRLEAIGAHMLDAPVSGGERGAAEGTLSIMVGGDAGTLESMRPILSCIGKTIVHVGPRGAGQVAKAANQMLLVTTLQGIAEAMVFAQANGVDFQPIFEALMKGFAASRMLEVFGPRMIQRHFVAGLDARLHHKDANIALDCAARSHSPVPGAALAAQTFNALMAREGTHWDSAAILQVIEDMSR
jgi:2-hydroxy-3-oxopropionate reductase